MSVIADRGYAICASPRSGSNLLCQYLASTGLLGSPLEYFNTQARRLVDRNPSYPEDAGAQIKIVLTRGTTPNGVYGVKLFEVQRNKVAQQLAWTKALPNLHFVYLERRDLLGQAISWCRMSQTRQFHFDMPKLADPVYSAACIKKTLMMIIRERAYWAMLFAQRGLEPLHLVYEEFVREPQGAVDAVAALIGLREPATINPDRIRLQIQRDEISEDWRKRFIAEPQNLHAFDFARR